MLQVICTVRDAAADVYGRPFFTVSQAVAIRTFSDEVNNSENGNQMNAHPKDFALYEIGTYDDSNAKMELLEAPKLLIQADQCITA